MSAIDQYIETLSIPAEVRRLINQANYDLYFGPLAEGEEEYPGFQKALGIISDALDDVGDVYVDEDADYFSLRAPEGWEDEDGSWVEPDWEHWVHYERYDVLKEIVGKELASYI